MRIFIHGPNHEGLIMSAGASQTYVPSSEAEAVRTDEGEDVAVIMVSHNGSKRSQVPRNTNFVTTILATSLSTASCPEVLGNFSVVGNGPEHAEGFSSCSERHRFSLAAALCSVGSS